jgi:thiol:disulfide interchange protein DsbD
MAAWRTQRPAADAFASGVLAVAAASPCTAPFMGAALGFALTQSTAAGLAVFAALGFGMALPYALLVLLPGWRSRLPRPGPWMLLLRQGLAFPMFATVVWLLWVLGLQTGADSAAKALLAFVALAFVVWLTGLPGSGHRVARSIGAAVLIGVLAWGWPAALISSPAPAAAATANPASTQVAWDPYDEAAVARHIAQGRPVFIDFTAAWCVSCQVNERLVLHTDATMQAFARSKVALMRADWTNSDAAITRALARLGRNGVPVYVLLRPGRDPLLLPEILTAGIVRDALAAL